MAGFVPNDPLSLSKNLRFVNAGGLPITEQYPNDYAITVANAVSLQIDNYNQVIATLSQYEDQIITLQGQVQNILTSGFAEHTVYSSCLSSGGTLPVSTVTSLLVNNTCSYNTVLGTPSALSTSVAAQCSNLSTGRQYGSPTGTMSGISGWKLLPTTTADTINNIWLTLCDLRAGMGTLFAAVTPTCQNVVVGFASVLTSYTVGIQIYFSGYSFIPTGFLDAGSSILITDSAGNTATASFNIVTSSTNNTPVTILLTSSSLLPNSNYTIAVTSLTSNATWNLNCSKTVVQTLINTISTCPILQVTAGTTSSVNYTATFLITTNSSYVISLLSSGTVVQSTTYSNPASVQSGVFSGLTSGTTYSVRATSTIGTENPVTCASYPVTTKTS